MTPFDQRVSSKEVSSMWFLGIDWAEKHLDFCLENPLGNVVIRSRVENSDYGFNSMLNLISQQNVSLTDVVVAIESPHQRVVDFLLVYPVNPKAVYDYRKSRFPSGSKSDTADAQLLSDYLREHHAHLRVWRLAEGELRQLSLLVEDRDKLVTEKVRLQNQIRSTLLGYFPQAIEAFSDLTTQTAIEFLSLFPTFESTQGRTEADWKTRKDEQRCFHPQARQRFLSAMKLKPIKNDEPVVKAKSLFVTTIVRQLKIVVRSLTEYNQQIETLLNKFDDGNRFRSLPGVDIILAAKLLVAFFPARERFASACELQTFFGTAPYTKGSGQYRSVHFRLACHKGMRAACKQMAIASLRSSTWAKSYFTRKRKEGKRAYHALRCLANCRL